MPKLEKLSAFKSKAVVAVSIVSLSAVSAMADVTIGADGAVSGSLDKGTFMGIAGVVVTLLGVIFGVKRGLALLR
ncbi:hypothetical protein [uncultured Campylobacter sp.]|uniref:hypothetical protein n=1 Tax=uncultured Campylobacter sp. TaxID=218934 RepID=UPI00261A271C|nr:hypothetical protein [uncultured Campylobacter sp.]